MKYLFTTLLFSFPAPVWAQSVAIDLGAAAGAHGDTTARLVQLTAFITLMSLAPSLLVMATAFTRIVMVLSLLRSALGAQGTPPNSVLIGLALFLTWFVMQPVFEQSWTSGIVPMMENRMGELDGIKAAAEPFRAFMLRNLRAADLTFFQSLVQAPAEETSWRIIMPAFMVGELRRAFEMGFLLFLPFLVIDMVVASVLMSLGMMMLPPNVVSLPFKLIFFALADGWRLVAGGLVRTFG